MTSNNHIVITAGYDCNSSCVMCVVGSKFHSTKNSTTEEIFSILVDGRKNKASSVEISGGEPTVRKDLPKLISLAKMLGYTMIGISTNGILLSDKGYCSKLVTAGLTYVTISLHSPNKKISEQISGTPNSFDRTIRGIKNVLNHKNLEVIIVTAVQKSNFKLLYQIGNLLCSFGIRYWNVCDLVPEEMAKEKYLSLSVNRIDLFNEIGKLVPLLNKIKIMLFNFTQCSIPKGFPKKNVVTMLKKSQEINFISYDKKSDFIKSTFSDNTLSKIKICDSCKYSKKCAGFWSDYFKLYGEKDIIELATKNSCLK